MFPDDRRNLNIGDKKIIDREEFKKQLKEKKEKSKGDKINQNSNSLDAIRMNVEKIRFKLTITDVKCIKDRENNLDSVLTILKSDRFVNDFKLTDEVIFKTFAKLKDSLCDIFNSFYHSKLLLLITKIIGLISRISSSNRIHYYNQYRSLFKGTLLSSFIILLYDLRRGNLIDDMNTNAKNLNFIFSVLSSKELAEFSSPMLLEMAVDKNFLFILDFILQSFNKLIGRKIKSYIIGFSITLPNLLYPNERVHLNFKLQLQYGYLLGAISKNCIREYVSHELTIEEGKLFPYASSESFFRCSRFISDFNFIQNCSTAELKCLILKSELDEEIKKKQTNYTFNEIKFYSKVFESLVDRDLTSFTYQECKSKIVYTLNNLLSYLLSFKSTYSNLLIEQSILLIYNSASFLNSIFLYSHEKATLHRILDYIFNKLIDSNNKTLIDEILKYSVSLINTKKSQLINSKSDLIVEDVTKSENFKLIEIIAFAIEQKIQFKADYFLIEFKSKDIYSNIPFNNIYLRSISLLLIRFFTLIINKTELHDIENLKDDLIIHSLKTLYNLDNEVDFAGDENFWIDMEIVRKILSFEESFQIEVVKIIPFIFPFKVRILKLCMHFKSRSGSAIESIMMNFEEFEQPSFSISRKAIFDQSFGLYLEGRLNPEIPWKITFINEFNQVEDGQDAGGLFYEYLIKLSEEAFSEKVGFFIESVTGYLIPNPNSHKFSSYHLQVFEFLGFIVGVSLYNDAKIWPQFSMFFLNNILGVESSFNELKNYDPDLYKNLVNLKDYQGDVENDICLNFTIEVNNQVDGNKGTEIIELIPNGRNINVNNENKLFYIKKVAQYKLESQFKKQSDSFKSGFTKAIDEEYIKMFTANELRQLIAGFDKEIDISDWKINTDYQHFNFNDKTHNQLIDDFWIIVNEFDAKEKEQLLFFVTSLKRPPLIVY